MHCRKFQDANVPFLTLKWNGHDSKEFYSVLVNPCGYVMIELISDTLNIELEMVPSKPRMVWKEWNDNFIANGDYLTPIKVKGQN